MLIRIDENTLREFPDDLAAQIIADPSYSEEEMDFTPQEVNVLIHSIFGTHYDDSISYEENLIKVRKIYGHFGRPREKAYELALKAVRDYNREIEQKDIGVADVNDVIHIEKGPPKIEGS